MAEDTDETQAAFDRGVISRIQEEHTEHLRAINGSTEKTAIELHKLSSDTHEIWAAIKALVVRLDTEAETRIKMAAALREAEKQKQEQAEHRWNIPMQRISWAITALAGLVALYFAVRG
jgi:predicted transcriptional regulator